jgi:hypothetical protein
MKEHKLTYYPHTREEKPKEITAWAIKDPDGMIFLYTISITEEQAKRVFDSFKWKPYQELGYSCVKVKITEI